MRELRGDWRDLFNGFSVALDLKKLLMGFIGLALTAIVMVAGPLLVVSIKNPNLWNELKSQSFDCATACAFYKGLWSIILHIAFWKMILVVAAFALILVIIWAYFGGAICRIAAVNLTKDEGLETSASLSFATKKYLSYLMPFIVCVLGFAFFFFWNWLGGLVGRIPYVGEILVMVFLPLAIVSGFIMVFIAIGFMFGRHLFMPTIAVEGSDSFDALSRSFSYLYARPWHFIWYEVVAVVYGLVTTAFVWLFGYLMIIVSLWAGAVGMGAKFSDIAGLLGIGGETGALGTILGKVGIHWHGVQWLPAASPETWEALPTTYHMAAYILAVWLVLVVGFILAYAVSYYFSAQTTVYLLMRKKVDDIDVKEIWEEEEEETPTAPGTEVKPEEKPAEPKETTGETPKV